MKEERELLVHAGLDRFQMEPTWSSDSSLSPRRVVRFENIQESAKTDVHKVASPTENQQHVMYLKVLRDLSSEKQKRRRKEKNMLKLAQELGNRTQQVADREKQLEALRLEISFLKKELADTKRNGIEERDESGIADGRLEKPLLETKSLSSDLLQAEVKRLEKTLSEKIRESSILRGKLEEQENALELLRRDLLAKDEELRSTETVLKGERTDSKQMRERIITLETACANHNQEKKEAIDRMSSLEMELVAANNLLQKQCESLESLKSDDNFRSQGKEAELKELHHALKVVQGSLEKFEDGVAAREEDCANLNQEKKEAMDRMSSLEMELVAANNLLQKQSESLESLKSENKLRIQEKEAELKELHHAFKVAQGSLEKLEGDTATRKEALHEMNADKVQYEDRICLMETELAKEKAEAERLSSLNTKLQEENSLTQQHLEEGANEILYLKAALAENDKLLSERLTKMRAYETESNDLREELQRKEVDFLIDSQKTAETLRLLDEEKGKKDVKPDSFVAEHVGELSTARASESQGHFLEAGCRKTFCTDVDCLQMEFQRSLETAIDNLSMELSTLMGSKPHPERTTLAIDQLQVTCNDNMSRITFHLESEVADKLRMTAARDKAMQALSKCNLTMEETSKELKGNFEKLNREHAETIESLKVQFSNEISSKQQTIREQEFALQAAKTIASSNIVKIISKNEEALTGFESQMQEKIANLDLKLEKEADRVRHLQSLLAHQLEIKAHQGHSRLLRFTLLFAFIIASVVAMFSTTEHQWLCATSPPWDPRQFSHVQKTHSQQWWKLKTSLKKVKTVHLHPWWKWSDISSLYWIEAKLCHSQN